MKFVSIDVETANADRSSICSIGAAIFEDGKLQDEWYSLIDPKDYFDPVNVSIHGIKYSDVIGAPTYMDASSALYKLVAEGIVVTHTSFDRVAIQRASVKSLISAPNCRWLDSASVARRTWADCSGFGLAAVCKRIGYVFNHHNALEDAKASGYVLLAAMRDSGLDLNAMLNRVRQPIDLSSSGNDQIKWNANREGPLLGEVIVITGTLGTMTKEEAKKLAASVGCEPDNNVTKKTTIVVVGDVDVQKLAGHEKTAKHRRAEELAMQGHSIRIISETDFIELMKTAL